MIWGHPPQGTDSDALRMDCFVSPAILILVLLFISFLSDYSKTLLWGLPSLLHCWAAAVPLTSILRLDHTASAC